MTQFTVGGAPIPYGVRDNDGVPRSALLVANQEPTILQTDLSSYEVYRPVAGGGFGTVHFGRDLGSNKPVAIKRLHPHLAYEPVLVRRFQQEAQRLRGLQHINIVQVLDQGTDIGSVPFIILEWVDGWTLSSVLERRGPLPVEEVVEIACQALAGLEVAHRRGIVHRDIKPSNLMLTAPPEQIVKVMDFGIAKDTLADAPGRQSHTQIGTLAYMAPEQFRGDPVDIRTDLYALGVTVYELLTGSRPYRDPLDTNVRPLTQLDSDIDPQLAEVVQRALSRAPAQRFETPTDMRSALEPFRQPAIRLSPPHTRPQVGLWTNENEVAKVEAPPAAAPARPPRWKFRTLVALACLAVVVLAATTAGAFAFGRGDDSPEPTPLPLASPTAARTPTVQPTPVTQAQSTAVPTFPPAPTSTPTLTAAGAWQATLARLDSVWQTDWPISIEILDGYLRQYPDQQPAIDKLYAALVEYGGALIDSGSTNEGIAQLERAQALAPGREEAQNALLVLTPTPAPASRATTPPARLPTSTPARIATAAPNATATRDSGRATAQPSATPAHSPTPVPAATQEAVPTATPPRAPTSAPTSVPTRATPVSTATAVRTKTPTLVATRTTTNPTATVRALP